jgi:hypothetical protein
MRATEPVAAHENRANPVSPPWLAFALWRLAHGTATSSAVTAYSAAVHSVDIGVRHAPIRRDQGVGVETCVAKTLAAPLISVVAAPPLLLFALTTSIQFVMLAASLPLPVRSSKLKV